MRDLNNKNDRKWIDAQIDAEPLPMTAGRLAIRIASNDLRAMRLRLAAVEVKKPVIKLVKRTSSVAFQTMRKAAR